MEVGTIHSQCRMYMCIGLGMGTKTLLHLYDFSILRML